jgi:hypothetical protein
MLNNERRKVGVAAVTLSVLLSVVVGTLMGGWGVVGSVDGLFFGLARPNATVGVAALPLPKTRPPVRSEPQPAGAPPGSLGSLVSPPSSHRPAHTTRSTSLSLSTSSPRTSRKQDRIAALKQEIQTAKGKYRHLLTQRLKVLTRS